jgi:acyl dehydratase
MKFDPEALARFVVPDVRQSYDARNCAFYALSIGLGRDPLDPRELPYVDHCRSDHRAFPAMALVLGYPGFWLAQPGTTADPTRVLHGEQTIEWHRPLATAGTVIGCTRLKALLDKGVGNHALIVSERVIRDAADGAPIATLTQTHVLLGAGGFAARRDAVDPPHRLPDRAPDHVFDTITRPEQALLYRLNGDTFGIHADPAAAQRAGFPQPILHGMCTAAIALHALFVTLAGYEVGKLSSVQLRFSSPVFPGELLQTDVWDDGSFRVRVPARGVTAIDNGLLTLHAREANE